MTNEKLIELIRQGNNELMEDLYIQNKPIIRMIAHRLQHDTNDYEDALQDAYFGLVAAVEAYDASKGYKFITFANYHITTAINRGKRSIKHIPEYLQLKAGRIRKAQNELSQQLNRLPTAAETAAATGYSVKEIQYTLKVIKPPQSIETPIADDLTVADTIPDNDIDFENEIAEADYKRYTKSILHTVIDELPEQERNVIQLYFFRRLTYKEIGQKLNVSQEMVRQSIGKGLRYLRRPKIVRKFIDNGLIYIINT